MKILFGGDFYTSEHINLDQSLTTLINAHDFFVLNFEGVITDSDISRRDKGTAFIMYQKAILGLKDSFGDRLVFYIANNHIFDFGGIGFNDTLSFLKKHNIKVIYDDLKVTVDDESLTMAAYTSAEPSVMSVTDAENYELNDYLDGVKKEDSDIAIMHWGDEYVHVPHYRISSIARLFSNKHSLIIGHHPHVIQGMDSLCGTSVYYSLGNFYMSDFFYKNKAKHIFPEECFKGLLVSFNSSDKTTTEYGTCYSPSAKTIALSDESLKIFEKRSEALKGSTKELHMAWENSYYDYLVFKNSLIINFLAIIPKYKGLLWNYLKKISGS